MIRLIYPKWWQDKLSFKSLILLPLSWLYFIAITLKNTFNHKAIKLPFKTICIGNITVGGTGKTLFVQYLANELLKKNYKICIITRGYGRKNNDTRFVKENDSYINVGDEALMLSKLYPTMVYSDAYTLAKILKEYDFDFLISDDGLQSNKFYKDYNILIIDGLRGYGNNRLLPAGPLRQPIANIKSIAEHAIIIGDDVYNVANTLPIFFSYGKITAQPLSTVSNHFYIAFAGIGNPQKFYSTLTEYNYSIKKTYDFPDHYAYNDQEISHLIKSANELNCKLITTIKDWYRISDKFKKDIIYLPVELNIYNSNNFFKHLYEKIT